MNFTAGYKLNENTNYEFTVSDETLNEVILDSGIDNTNISDYCYTALIDNRINTMRVKTTSDYFSPTFDSWISDECVFGLYRGNTFPFLNADLTTTNHEIYERNFLVWSGTIYPGTPQEKSGLFLVMDIKDIKKWYVDYNAGMFTTDTVASTITKYGQTTPIDGYTGSCYKYTDNTLAAPIVKSDSDTPVTEGIGVLNILEFSEEFWVGNLNPSTHGAAKTFECKNGWSYGDSSYVRGYLDTGDSTGRLLQKGTIDWAGLPKLPEMEFPDARDAAIVVYPECDNGIIIDASCAASTLLSSSALYCKDIDTLLTWQSWAGLKFYYDGTYYKPIIEQGVVVGYTDDMTVPSEWDDMTNVTGNNISPVPPVPPEPGADDDNSDPVSTAGAPYAKGLVNYYAMTAGSVLIDHIADALSTWDLQNTGKDLFKNLVSCKLIKPPAAIPTSGSEPFTIYGEKPQYEGADITLPVVSGNPDASFGPYTISRKFDDFRDYAPYTRVTIYLPYCGWCDLPSHVVGRSVSVKYFTDIIAATVRAVVFCGNNIVAEAAGVMGLDIPFTADAVGMKQAGVVSGLTAYAGGALQTAAGVAQLVTSKDAKGLSNVFSGGSKLLSAYTQTAEAFNENTTEISGKNGDGCSLSGATNIIIKIIRPKYGASSDPPYVPAGFAHSVGFVSNKQVRVGNISGLLIADNVDTSGIAGATDAERAEIKRVLETGLIVNAAPE